MTKENLENAIKLCEEAEKRMPKIRRFGHSADYVMRASDYYTPGSVHNARMLDRYLQAVKDVFDKKYKEIGWRNVSSNLSDGFEAVVWDAIGEAVFRLDRERALEIYKDWKGETHSTTELEIEFETMDLARRLGYQLYNKNNVDDNNVFDPKTAGEKLDTNQYPHLGKTKIEQIIKDAFSITNAREPFWYYDTCQSYQLVHSIHIWEQFGKNRQIIPLGLLKALRPLIMPTNKELEYYDSIWQNKKRNAKEMMMTKNEYGNRAATLKKYCNGLGEKQKRDFEKLISEFKRATENKSV